MLAGFLHSSREVMLVCRERNDGCYTALTYLSAKVIEEALVALVQSLVFACIVYFPCEFTGSFGLFWYTYFQTTLIGICEPSPCTPSALVVKLQLGCCECSITQPQRHDHFSLQHVKPTNELSVM